jgi:hypothetical protein
MTCFPVHTIDPEPDPLGAIDDLLQWPWASQAALPTGGFVVVVVLVDGPVSTSVRGSLDRRFSTNSPTYDAALPRRG